MGQTLSTFLLASGRKRYTGSVLVILVYLLYRRRKSANARKLAEQNGDGKNDPKNAKSKIWEFLKLLLYIENVLGEAMRERTTGLLVWELYIHRCM